MIAMVKRTLLRRSATRKMFARRFSTLETYRFWCWLPAAGRLEGGARRRREGVRRDVDRRGDRAATQDLDQVALAREAVGHEHVGVDVADPERAEGVEVDRGVRHAEGIGEALQLGDALEERQLAALEAGRDLAAGLLALGAASGRLATLAGDAAPDDPLAVRRALGRLEIVQLHL